MEKNTVKHSVHSTGKKYINDIRPARKSQIQVWQSALLCRACYVGMVGKNKKAIEEYIRNQVVEEEVMYQM